MFQPLLRGKPTVVLTNNDGHVIALSAEQKTGFFSNTTMIIGYCNGFWCGQTIGMFIRAKYSLVNIGCAQGKLKYYRGGVQAWTA